MCRFSHSNSLFKAHMEDLKAENARLQRIVDVLDSQPELLFCVTADGYITYMSEQAINHFRCVASSLRAPPSPLGKPSIY